MNYLSQCKNKPELKPGVTQLFQEIEQHRIQISKSVNSEVKSQFGQYFTSIKIARFMAGLFNLTKKNTCRLLDPGAGIGSLSAAFLERWASGDMDFQNVELDAFEIDEKLLTHLNNTFEKYQKYLNIFPVIRNEDFITTAVDSLSGNLYHQPLPRYSHAILNPPYRKIKNNSDHRLALKKVGIETVNLYSAFVALALSLLEINGELVAIIPRSFCNGTYYQPFRKFILMNAAIRHIHLFKSRDEMFKDDNVLQENIIIMLERGASQEDVIITTSTDSSFADVETQNCPIKSIVLPNDPRHFIHIPTSPRQDESDRPAMQQCSLKDLGINVSTGPVVDYRLKEYLFNKPGKDTVPLLYPGHFIDGKTRWPSSASKKPNAILRGIETEKWLFPNGFYCVVRRFSSKEEKRRIIASVVRPEDFPDVEMLGFENHLNIFHENKHGLPEALAYGLASYLSSNAVDNEIRSFNGHTQVNAADLSTIRYPDREKLIDLGKWAIQSCKQDKSLIGEQKGEYRTMTKKNINHIVEANRILISLGLPRAQQNERSALCLLALLNLTPEKKWSEAEAHLMGITPIMNWIRTNYQKEYAPNTRETIRKDTMHYFVEAGIVVYNPDNPTRPVNSPKAVYQIEPLTLILIQNYGMKAWRQKLENYIDQQGTLSIRYAKEREQNRIPVRIVKGKKITLSPGEHSELIRAIIEQFAPRFAPGSVLIYAGDTGDKWGYFDSEKLHELGVKIDSHGKMPDVILYAPNRKWLLLIESVTSRGPVDSKRHSELAKLFKESNIGLVYITAFPTRSLMARHLSDIAWETEVWVAESPSHLIHFNGERFLGPYK